VRAIVESNGGWVPSWGSSDWPYDWWEPLS